VVTAKRSIVEPSAIARDKMTANLQIRKMPSMIQPADQRIISLRGLQPDIVASEELLG
jgi:hypothetical protein